MRVGSFLLVLVLALVGLGYLGSDYLKLRQNQQDCQKQIGQLTSERDQQQQKLDQAGQTIQSLQDQLDKVNAQLSELTQQAERSNQTIKGLTDQISQVTAQRDQLAQKVEQSSQIIQSLQTRVTDLDNQLASARTNVMEASAPTPDEIPANRMLLNAGFLLLPGLALVIPVTINAIRRRNNYIRLTKAEIQQIIRQRRGQF